MENQVPSSTRRNTRLPLRVILCFDDPDDERRFVAHYTDFYFRYAQVSIGIGFLLILGDFLADLLAFPDVRANFDRLAVVLPLMALLLGYTVVPQFKKHWQGAMATFVVAIAAAIFWALLAIDRDGGMGLNSWIGILNLVFVELFCFVILGIQFRYALIAGTIILLAFLYAIWFIFRMEPREVSYWSYHVVTLFLLTAGIGWWRELLIRQDFATRTALDEARQAAESLARIKSEFLANMSHEIRTPLNGVLGLAQIGERNSRGREVRETFARILDSGRLLLGIVNDVLDFSKIEAGKLTVERVPVALARVLDEAVDPVRERARAKGLTLTIHKSLDLPAVCAGDPLRMTQVLLNLLANAVKFTEHGSIELNAGRVGETLVFQVTDTGIGVDAAQLEHIFAAFEQIDSSVGREFGGTGLGLSISRRLAALMGGELRVRSQLGRGSTFELRLPYYAATMPLPPTHQATAIATSHGPRLRGVKVLAVEDHEVNRIILADILTTEGAQVVMADNGMQAVETVARSGHRAFDIVLMDIQMREMDGYEATRHILELVPDLPVVGQSAHVMAAERATSLAAGMRDHIAKPIDVDDLVAKILRHSRPSGPTAAASDGAALIDWAGLEDKFRDRPGYVAHIVATILRTDCGLPAQLRAAAMNDDMAELTFLAHGIYNTALVTMSHAIEVLAKNTEIAARAKLPEATTFAANLATTFERVLDCLAQGPAYAPQENLETR